MMDRDNCPHCGVSLVGNRIPDEQRESFGGGTHFSRVLGIEVLGGYDGVLFYQCPDCKGRWHRWPEGSPQYAQAVALWSDWDAKKARVV